MAISVDWETADPPVILFTIEGAWDWPELFDADLKVKDMLDQASGKTYTIIIVRNTVVPSNTLAQMPRISQFHFFNHPDAGMAVLVSTVPMADIAGSIGARVYDSMSKMKIVKTIEEARVLIEEHAKAA
jgi:hypothetical protein